MRRLFGGIAFQSNFPINFQYWQPKAPTLIPQLPLLGKNTDKLLLRKIIYRIILQYCG
jgi:hypothetical protein